MKWLLSGFISIFLSLSVAQATTYSNQSEPNPADQTEGTIPDACCVKHSTDQPPISDSAARVQAAAAGISSSEANETSSGRSGR